MVLYEDIDNNCEDAMFSRWSDIKTHQLWNIGTIFILPVMAVVEYMLYRDNGDQLFLVAFIIVLTVSITSIIMAISPDSPLRFSAGYIFRPGRPDDEVRKMIHQFLRRRKLRYSKVAKPERFHMARYNEVLYLERRGLFIGMYRDGFVIFTYDRYEGDVKRLKDHMMELFDLK